MLSPEYQSTDDAPIAKLCRGMEHIRLAVSVNPLPRPPTSSTNANASPVPSESSKDANSPYGVPSAFQPVRRPPHRSHDPSNNHKRSDPFQFGSRYLEENDDIFEFNAWDHVEVDDTYKQFAEQRYQEQRESRLGEWDMKRINASPASWWNKFYTHNTSRFFKNRNWLFNEFPTLAALTAASSPPATILEIGAGAGNTAFPILALNQNPGLRIHAVDYASAAVEVMKRNEAYIADGGRHISASVWDLASADGALPEGVATGSVDVVILVFTLSALDPASFARALRNVWGLLRPGGEVLFRDYGRGDLAQVRFRRGRWMGEGWYVRGDGTRVFFASEEEVGRLWGGVGEWRVAGEGEKGEEEEEEKGKEGEEVVSGGQIMTNGDDALGRDRQEILNGSGQNHERLGSEDKCEDSDNGQCGSDQRQENTSAEDEDWRPRFEILDLGTDRRMLVNRKRKIKMYRCWIQGRFRKPLDA